MDRKLPSHAQSARGFVEVASLFRGSLSSEIIRAECYSILHDARRSVAIKNSQPYAGVMTQSGRDLGKAVLDAVADRLGQTGKIDAAYLLGSAASGRLRKDSDVDIALLPARGITLAAAERIDLAADIERLVGLPVDLGILNTGNLVYAKEAIARGKLFFERDPAVRARFAMLVLSMYASLQETRREVLNAYAA